MSKMKQKGFGLIEVMVSLVLGIVVVLGISQIFVSAKQTYLTQDASARLQEDARYALSRMVQELRMAGMFGCVSLSSLANKPTEFDDPIDWTSGSSTLRIITANPTSGAATTTNADWTIITDCRSIATVANGVATPGSGEIALPIRQVEYKLDSGSLQVSEGGGGFQPLISGVTNFAIEFGQATTATDTYVSGDYVDAASADMARVRSVRILLEMTDGEGRVAPQTYTVVAALRNRLL
jgi:type IV pilus assembly protein PilW